MLDKKNLPISIDQILKQAFTYWRKTIWFQLFFSLLYLTIFLGVFFYFGTSLGIIDNYLEAIDLAQKNIIKSQEKIIEIYEDVNYIRFYYIMLATSVFLFPMHVGFFKIYRKMDMGEKPELNDLFAGYIGTNFFRYVSYYLFWSIVFIYTAPTILLGTLWVLSTYLTAPLMFFQNKRFLDCFGDHIALFRNNFLVVFTVILLGFIFKVLSLFTIFLFPFVLPFSLSIVYVLYQTFFAENENEVLEKK